jgi:methylmalonyl-CoA/ethylmalonyl-CoA epimerase
MMFKRIDHIGVIVANMSDAKHWIEEVFGLSFQRALQVSEGQISAAFYDCGNTQIELLEIGDPELRKHRLGLNTSARIEHIAVEVDDLKEALAKLTPLGVRTTAPEPRRTGDMLSVWTVAETTGGVSYQLMQRATTTPSR